jgi:hypothetical protein
LVGNKGTTICEIFGFQGDEIHVLVFWAVMSCNDVVGYKHNGGSYFLHLHHPEDRTSKVLRNVGILSQNPQYHDLNQNMMQTNGTNLIKCDPD